MQFISTIYMEQLFGNSKLYLIVRLVLQMLKIHAMIMKQAESTRTVSAIEHYNSEIPAFPSTGIQNTKYIILMVI